MQRPFPILFAVPLAIAALAWSGPAPAVPGGEIGTLEPGRYACELPGDAAGPAGHRAPAFDFTVIGASSYRADGRIGSYLLTGDTVVMTSGPREGLRFLRESRGFLRQAGNAPGAAVMRCVLSASALP